MITCYRLNVSVFKINALKAIPTVLVLGVGAIGRTRLGYMGFVS